MIVVFLILHAFVTVAMIGIILLQKSDGSGPFGMGGGGGQGSLFTARGVANILTRTTAVLAALFIGNCLLIGVLTQREMEKENSFFSKAIQQTSKDGEEGETADDADTVPAAADAPATADKAGDGEKNTDEKANANGDATSTGGDAAAAGAATAATANAADGAGAANNLADGNAKAKATEENIVSDVETSADSSDQEETVGEGDA
jgi:preprotein translocase subunit SecG